VTPPVPTDAELALLRILWSTGPATVRQVHEVLGQQRDVAYTTVLKMLQVMHDKGLVVRDTSQRSHIYTPVQSEDVVQGALVSDLLDKAFGGDPGQLVLRALSERPADAGEIAAIRQMLDALERGEG
jgi:predicted transcriptional regulator